MKPAPIFPSSIVDAMVRNDILQIVAFSVLFAMAVSAIGEKEADPRGNGQPMSQVMFRFTSYVMMFAPIGVGAAMAHTIATQGLGVLVNLGKLIGSLYVALFFVVVVLGSVALPSASRSSSSYARCASPRRLPSPRRAASQPCPRRWRSWNAWACRRIVGFVMPTGYSFNLDGTTLYLAMASVFIAQAAEATTGQHMDLGRQFVMMLTLMITSKGIASSARFPRHPLGDRERVLARKHWRDWRRGDLRR